MSQKITDYHQLHKRIYCAEKVLSAPITLVCASDLSEMKFNTGESVQVRVEEYDWGNSYTALSVENGKIYLQTKTIGLVPVVTDLEMEEIIKNEIK